MGVWSAFFTPAATCGRPCHVPWVRSSPAQHRATRSLHTGTRCSARALSLRKRTRPGDECVRGRKPNVLSGFGESLYMSLSVFWSFGLLVFRSFGLSVFRSNPRIHSERPTHPFRKTVPKDQKTERPKDQKTERPKDQKTERPKDQKTERPKDQKTERPKDRKIHVQ